MTQTSIRTRPYGVFRGSSKMKDRTFVNNSPTSESNYTLDLEVGGSQYTESEGHPFRNSKRKGMEDLGGEFFTTKRYVEFAPRSVGYSKQNVHNAGKNYELSELDGFCLAVDPHISDGFQFDDFDTYSNDTVLDSLGASAIAAVAPTNPVVNLLSGLAELRNEGLPHLPGSQTWESGTNAARNAGDEYLNAQFGWVPLVNDVTGFASVVGRAPSVIEQYRRDIGKPIRRSYDFSSIRESYAYKSGIKRYPYMVQAPTMFGKGTLYIDSTLFRRRWFSGCFTYYFPDKILGSQKLSDFALLAERVGLKPTPEVLWEVAPWSWATDWFANTGDLITNWTNFHENGLVMRYGYMMEHSICVNTYSLKDVPTFSAGAPPISDVRFVIETKVRRKANPYGFGVSWDGLSSFQTSILAALGISKFGR